ncbi:hypothetical protein VaNZ11_014585 [Volvox africanus]|uniref:Nicastrin n=1 Tax=Volvox africanus TaxID=51714 RepID=A0ABQ5SK64_9CHLO|nr:hypothetical protein VaNZ11_014585 [Volvox africanus]
MHRHTLVLSFLVVTAWSILCMGKDDMQGWKQVKGLKGAMYAEMNYGRACIKLLNSSGPQGCEAPDQEDVVAPLVHSKDLGIPYKGKRVVVVPSTEADKFLSQMLADSEMRSRVAGVLVDPTGGRPSRHSTAEKFPSAAYALYDNRSYVWNPVGTGFTRQYFGMPIYMLTASLAAETARRAAYNAHSRFKGGRHVARMVLPMQANGDSLQCIAEDTCLPVGGYSVWTAVPPLPDPTYATVPARSITLLVAQMDSNAMIHDLVKGAATSVAGLTAALAALTLLVRSGAATNYTRQLAFVALQGEGFDYMGSKRLLYEMSLNSSYVQGLRMENIDQVVEVGPIGAAWNATDNSSTFFIHSQRNPPGEYGGVDALVDAAKQAARGTQARVVNASTANPGLPPSSLTSFLRVNASISGLVLTDFDTSFKGPYYQSEYDDGLNAFQQMVEAITDAALVLARMLHSLAMPSGSSDLALNRTEAAAVARALASCTLTDDPGLNCPEARAFINPETRMYEDGTTSTAIFAYPGVMSFVSVFPKRSPNKPQVPSFIFNYLGNLTAVLPRNASATCSDDCEASLTCIGWRYNSTDKSGMGHCLNTTTSFVPAYSLRLAYNVNNSFRWSVDNSTRRSQWELNYNWPEDSAWTESNWPENTPRLMIYQQESMSTQVITLVVGLLLTAGTAAVSWIGLKLFERHLKVQ